MKKKILIGIIIALVVSTSIFVIFALGKKDGKTITPTTSDKVSSTSRETSGVTTEETILTTEETTSVPVQVTGQDGTIGNYEITIIRASVA